MSKLHKAKPVASGLLKSVETDAAKSAGPLTSGRYREKE
jgi:hypothetical protein